MKLPGILSKGKPQRYKDMNEQEQGSPDIPDIGDIGGSWPVYQLLLAIAAIALLLLPFITTFNEFLTRIVMALGLNAILVDWVVPTLVKMVAVIMAVFGIPVAVTSSALYLGSFPGLPVYISWNCVGWQSFILFALTLVTGLQGPYTLGSKLQCIALGFLGTFLINIFRIVTVGLVAYYFGRLPAVVFHDYFGTLLTIAWLGLFWYLAYNSVLEREDLIYEETPAT